MNDNRRGEWRTPPQMWERLKPLAREMRRAPTPAEEVLWRMLRGGRLNGLKFRRQHPIERFIVDFYCRETRLVIEVDGPIHEHNVEDDGIREAYLEANNLTILRFHNDDVLAHPEAVMATIEATLASGPPPLR